MNLSDKQAFIRQKAFQNQNDPDCLVLAKLTKDQPLHAVIAIDRPNDRIFVITVYRPSPDRWENDWKSRK